MRKYLYATGVLERSHHKYSYTILEEKERRKSNTIIQLKGHIIS